jgi:hypothetical protein
MQPEQLKNFLKERTKTIIEKLENEFQKFNKYIPTVPAPYDDS